MLSEQTPLRTRAYVISSRRRLFDLGLRELWHHRELVYFFVWRDIKLRYKQTVIGAAWAVIQPLVLMVAFSLVLGKSPKLAPPAGIPRPIFYFSALLPWSYFADALQASTSSVVGSQSMVTKVYFPRITLPLAGTMPPLLEFVISFGVLVALMLGFHVPFTWRLVLIPPLVIVAVLTAFGAGAWLSAMYAVYRDIGQAIPFVIQVLLFTSPVVLRADRVPQWFRPYYGINPMTGVIEGIRWCVTGYGRFPFDLMPTGLAFCAFLVVGGVLFFTRMEDLIIDVV